MKAFTLLEQNKKTIKEQLGCRHFFLNAAVKNRKILIKSKYRIGTPYRQILNIKGLGSGLKT